MEILQFLLSFFINEYGGEGLGALFSLLKENDFNVFSALKNAKPGQLAPLTEWLFNANKSCPTSKVGQPEKLTPVKFANKEIKGALYAYLSNRATL